MGGTGRGIERGIKRGLAPRGPDIIFRHKLKDMAKIFKTLSVIINVLLFIYLIHWLVKTDAGRKTLKWASLIIIISWAFVGVIFVVASINQKEPWYIGKEKWVEKHKATPIRYNK